MPIECGTPGTPLAQAFPPRAQLTFSFCADSPPLLFRSTHAICTPGSTSPPPANSQVPPGSIAAEELHNFAFGADCFESVGCGITSWRNSAAIESRFQGAAKLGGKVPKGLEALN